VSGRVVASATDVPLAGATVALDGTALGATTGPEGRFLLEAVPAGEATLQVRYLGFTPRMRTVQVRPGETTQLTVELTSAPMELEGLEITARAGRVRAALPGAASMLTADALDAIAPIGAQEALAHVPGVYGAADDGMANARMSVGIRGLSPRRTQRILVLEDGMPIQPAPYVFSPLYYNPPAERINAIEVIKGSAAIRHGPQTMGGVVNYLTKRPRRRRPGGALTLTTGTHGYVSAFGEAGGFGTASVRPQVQVLFKRGSGFRQNNDFYQFNGTGKLHFLIGSDRSLYLKANVDFERTKATYTGLTPHSFENDPAFNPKSEDLYQVFRASLGAIYNRQYSEGFQGTTKLYANVFDRPWWREKDVFVRASDLEEGTEEGAEEGAGEDAFDPVPWYTGGPLVRTGGGEQYFGNLRTFYVGGLEHSFDAEHRLLGQEATLEVGGRVHYERFRDDRKISDEIGVREGVFFRGNPEDPETLDIVGRSHTYETTALSLHALEDVQWGRLRLSPGVRLEVFEQERIDRLDGATYRDETSAVVLPGLGFNYDLGALGLGREAAGLLGDARFRLFGGIHRGYTPPSSATLQIVGFGPAVASPDDGGGLDLRSEKSWNSELGLRGRTGAARFELTGFHLYIEDLVGGRTVFQNLGVVRTYGLELEGTLDGAGVFAPLPTLNVAYTLLQTEVLEGRIPSATQAGAVVDIGGNELPYAPTHTLTAGLEKSFFDGRFSARADLRYVGRVYTDLENIETTTNRGDQGPVPAYAVLDAGASYRFSKDLRLRLTAKNVTDNVYIGSRLHSNPGQPQAHLSSGILPGPRRQINLSLRYNF
jgi:Fe(3+) dicitrate transport protein